MPPRGRKSWAVLAYVALAELPVSRERLSSLLFSEAADPSAALRWTLAELRRALGGTTDALRGDPDQLSLPEGTMIDVMMVSAGQADAGFVRSELLEAAGSGSNCPARTSRGFFSAVLPAETPLADCQRRLADEWPEARGVHRFA